MNKVPSLLLGRDIDAMKTKVGIERAVVDILRKFGVLPPEPKQPPRFHIVENPNPIAKDEQSN